MKEFGLPPEVQQEIQRTFLREVRSGYGRALEVKKGLAEGNIASAEALEVLAGFFHKICGTAPSLGYASLGMFCATCERTAKSAMKGTMPLDAAMAVIADGLSAVAALLAEGGETGESATPTPNPAPTLPHKGILPLSRNSPFAGLEKIMVVDDDVVSAELLRSTLRSAGYQIVISTAPRKALGVIETELPDLIVMDVVMPGINGFQLCQAIRGHPALQFTPLIFVTAQAETGELVKGLSVGGNDYVLKPFSPDELLARVRAQLDRLAGLREAAVRDGLTGCFNHMHFKELLDREVVRHRRYGGGMAVALIDLDHFKKVNDNYGHLVGDSVLQCVARTLKDTVRATDAVARYGGEEFGILFINTKQAGAIHVCERIRKFLETTQWSVKVADTGEEVQVSQTISVGLAVPRQGDDALTIISRADSALYQAKRNGRNRLELADPQDTEGMA
jgi:diguanylate cyclase (GGDEF)-like protein